MKEMPRKDRSLRAERFRLPGQAGLAPHETIPQFLDNQ